jgi:hypothetical protein
VKIETIYVYLLEEGTDVWRPCRAEHLGGDRYRILDEAPDDEIWEFVTGDVVRCRLKKIGTGHPKDFKDTLVAHQLAT